MKSLLLVVAAALPCAGLCGGLLTPLDLDAVEQLAEVLEHADPEQAAVLLAAGAAEANVVTGECKELFAAAVHVAPDLRGTLLARAHEVCDMACPGPGKGAQVMIDLAGLPAADRTAGLQRACGPDKVFGGTLARVASGMNMPTYAAYRHLYETLHARLEGSARGDALWARFDRTRPAIALALDRAAPEVRDAEVSGGTSWVLGPVVAGDLDERAIADRLAGEAPALRACLDGGPDRPAGALEREIAEQAGLLAALREAAGGVAPDGARVQLVLALGPDGTLWSVDARESSLDGATRTCVLDRVHAMTFPAPRDGDVAVIVWPLTLRAAPPPVDGYGSGGGGFGSHGEGGLDTVSGEPIILGALDRSLIDAVVKRNRSQIRYCYQRELVKTPDLAGKLTVKFVVAKDGTVSSAITRRTTLNNRAVEDCVNGRFLRFQFPEPKGGGIAIVSYPFEFSPG